MKIIDKGNTMPSDNNLKAKTAMFTIFLILTTALAMSCRECPTEQPDYDIYLTAEDVFSTSVVLSVTLPDSGDVSAFALDRNDSTVATYTCYDDDTLIIDEDLMPDTDYIYRVRFLKDGKTKSESDPVAVHTMDTTSHAISYWEIDTLGISGGIYDLWIVSENNIWAVGQIIVDDPDSSFDGSGEEYFNAVHWDGEKWSLMRMERGAPIESIWYFDDNNIWAAGIPIHWDGEKWTYYHLWDMGVLDPDDGTVEHIWASSPDNIYFVGWKGSIVHYNGSSFTKMESGTTCRLEDVWGIDDNHIWAVGTALHELNSVLLFYNGKTWRQILDPLMGETYGFNSLWTDNPYLLFLNGGSGRCIADLLRGNISRDMSAGEWFGYDIYGTAYNDIFTSGQGSEILHFNGLTWHLYSEFQNIFGAWGLFKTIKVSENLVVAGGEYYTGLYGIPIVIRGYR